MHRKTRVLVKIGAKSLPGTNTLPYHENFQITDQNFNDIGTWRKCYRTFCGRNL